MKFNVRTELPNWSQGALNWNKQELIWKKGKKECDEAVEETNQTLADAKAQIDDAQEQLDSFDELKWYVFSRDDNPGYGDYESDTQRVDAVASVFPVFFIAVVILVTLTTMTRMVEDQRIQIGTLKALGYSSKSNYGQVFYLLFPCRYYWLYGRIGCGNLLIPQLNLYGIRCNVSCTAGFDLFRTMVISVFGNYCSNFMYIICFYFSLLQFTSCTAGYFNASKGSKTWQTYPSGTSKLYLETFELYL